MNNEAKFAPLHPTMDLRQVALAVCSATAVYVWYKRYYTLPISDVPGPKNPSWIYGISIPPTKSSSFNSWTPEQDTGGGGNVKKPVYSRGK